MPLPDPHDLEDIPSAAYLYDRIDRIQRDRITKLEKENRELRESIRRVVRAIRQKGPVPKYHDKIERQHRKTWPRLWLMLDMMLKSYDKAISREST